MMSEPGLRRMLPDQSSGSLRTFGSPRHSSITNPIPSKRVCFYKSGDPQFSGLRMVINNRTFKTFDALLDSLSKKVPLPFGVRNITTPRGIHAINTLDELEDGKSYICSDTRKVKPINLALARKKLPPWYHARPVSSRRQTVKQARVFPGWSIHRQEPVVVRSPKRLLVFRNGDPSVRHTVVVQKRTTPTFESILEYISELMQFQVVKLHTTDGGRVDGLPGLILCSWTVVAAGREPFRPANYSTQKSPPPTRLPTNRAGVRKIKALIRKKRSFSSKSRNFSPSSQRYIVNQIHNSIVGSSSGLPSNHGNSSELESGHLLESVAETEEDMCLDNEAVGQDGLLPTGDDIEKSFRVNQDGSMTVEMKVRLTIKEEETLHWTTTLTRSSVANQLDMTCLPEPEPEQENCSPESNPLDLRNPAASTDRINRDRNKDDHDEDPPSLGNGTFTGSGYEEEDNRKMQMNAVSPWRAPTPGHTNINKRQASTESVTSVTADGIQEGMVGSYSYRAQAENGAMTEKYCMVQQSSRPVPKPRQLGSVDANSVTGKHVSSFKSAEILQIESSREEVTETVLHIYEQKTCHDNFHANVYGHDASTSGAHCYRPGTSETGQLSSHDGHEPKLWRPSTASESISIWRADSKSVKSDLTLSSPKTGTIQVTKHQIPKSTKDKDKQQQRQTNKDKRISSTPETVNKRFSRLTPPGKRPKDISAKAANKRKQAKTFSSAGFIKRIYGNTSKSAKSTKRRKKRQKRKAAVTAKSSQPSGGAVKQMLRDPNTQLKARETVSLETSRLDVPAANVSQPRGTLTRHTSIHQEKKHESMPLPDFYPPSCVTNEYVEDWLEKAHINPSADSDVENKTENWGSEYNHGSIRVTEDVKRLEKNSEVQTSQSLKTVRQPETVRQASVKQRIKSFEIKSGPSSETTSQPTAQNHETNTGSSKGLSDMNAGTNNNPTERSSDGNLDNKSRPIKVSIQTAPPPCALSMALPPPPSPPLPECPAETPSNSEHNMMDVPPVTSSPLHRHSSVSSQTSYNPPLSVGPTSGKAQSPADHTMVQTDVPLKDEAQLQRSPSIKRTPLISNTSLERKMSLRKACVDNYTLGSVANTEMTTSSIPMGDDVLPTGLSAAETQRPGDIQPGEEEQHITDRMSSPSCCTSASPTSSTSEERPSSASLSPAPLGNPPFEEATVHKTQPSTQQEASSPKPLQKTVKLTSSLSPERKTQTMKTSFELPSNSPKLPPSHAVDKRISPNVSPSPERKQLYKSKPQRRPSPYSQSLDLTSPPVRQKSNKKLLSRNVSSDNSSEPTNSPRRKTASQRKQKSSADVVTPLDADRTDRRKADSQADTQEKMQSNMEPVLEKICYSIKSIGQRKRPSKSSSVPDFSSHVASTFGSSTKTLLAFLSVMALKEALTNLNMDQLNVSDVSCAEALRMIDSLREVASIEDPHELKNSLSDLQKSASKQLLESWKGFQELSDRCRSRSSTPNYPEQEGKSVASLEQECVVEEEIIDEIMNGIDLPETLKEALASLSGGPRSESDDEEKLSSRGVEKSESTENSEAHLPDFSTHEAVSQDDRVNVDVGSMIRKLTSMNQQEQSNKVSQPKKQIKDTLSQVDAVMTGDVSRKTDPDIKSSETEDPDLEWKQLQTHSEAGCPSYEGESSADDARQEVSCKESLSNAERGGNQSSEEEIEREEMNQESRKGDLSISESHFQEEEDKPADTNYYAQLNASREGSSSSPESENQSLLEEEQTEVKCKELRDEDPLPKSAETCSSERRQESETDTMRQNVILSGSTCKSDVDVSSSSEAEPKELQFIMEERFPDPEEEQESMEAEEEVYDHEEQMETCKALPSWREEEEEDGAISEEEDIHADEEQIKSTHQKSSVRGDPCDSRVNLDSSSFIEQTDDLSNQYSFDEEDSGNELSSCGEHADTEQPQVEDEPIRSSAEEEPSYYEKEPCAEGGDVDMDRNLEENPEEHQALPAIARLSEETHCEKEVEKVKHHYDITISQSVAERVSLLEKQVADAQRTKNLTESSAITCSSQVNLVSDDEELSSKNTTSPTDLSSRSAPQSSLSFSYDSSGVITTEPEGNRVKSIREMFLAKSFTDAQHGQRRLTSPNTTELCELRADTSASGGYQSQTSAELSSGEEDSSRKSITKGFVRRTIQRLYGKTDDYTNEDRPPSAPKQKNKIHSILFSPLDMARSKGKSDLSYFNSTNALDTLTEATRCIAFNAQVRPGGSVPADTVGALLGENTVIRKSVSEPVGINKNLPNDEGMCEDTQESVPYSFFSTTSEPDDQTKPKRCTYFSLPHASDSDACQDDLSVVSKSRKNSDSGTETKDISDNVKAAAVRNGMLAGVGDFKMMDNKVHPLIEAPPDGEVVVVQPGKGQGVVNRRIPEPDVLDLLYNFCGENCPIL